jgi:hypothetical protein
MMSDQRIIAPQGNRDYPWEKFSPEEYFRYNYVGFRQDDRQIVEIVRKFFVETFSSSPLPPGARGIDVGTGANLYPALTMLPFCHSITLYEYSVSNVAWLKSQQARGWPSWNEAWDKFWADLCLDSAYEDVSDPRKQLSRRVTVEQGDVLDRPVHERWDVGTMFFVAESITGKREEFLDAVDHFFAMLKPAAPFAMAFMEHSEGYHVGSQPFPATDIGPSDVLECLGARADNVKLHRLGPGNKPLREHYTGMIVAHGLVKHLP